MLQEEQYIVLVVTTQSLWGLHFPSMSSHCPHLSFTTNLFQSNKCSNGGAIGNLFGSLSIYNSIVNNNQATGLGANPGILYVCSLLRVVVLLFFYLVCLFVC